jgi:hypothetical protein
MKRKDTKSEAADAVRQAGKALTRKKMPNLCQPPLVSSTRRCPRCGLSLTHTKPRGYRCITHGCKWEGRWFPEKGMLAHDPEGTERCNYANQCDQNECPKYWLHKPSMCCTAFPPTNCLLGKHSGNHVQCNSVRLADRLMLQSKDKQNAPKTSHMVKGEVVIPVREKDLCTGCRQFDQCINRAPTVDCVRIRDAFVGLPGKCNVPLATGPYHHAFSVVAKRSTTSVLLRTAPGGVELSRNSLPELVAKLTAALAWIAPSDNSDKEF